jgi:serine protease AprX
VRNLKSGCVFLQFTRNDTCFVDVPGNDSDTPSVGGHGTHVAGIAAGVPTTLTNGKKLQGAAPGAKLIGLSVGQLISVYGGDSGLNWVLEHHRAPCGAGVSAVACPPIKVTNNSYGVGGGSEFDPNSATVKLQRALAAEGVVTAWAPATTAATAPAAARPPTAGHGPDAGHPHGRQLRRQGDRHPQRHRLHLQLARRPGQLRDLPGRLRPGTNIQSACRAWLPICSTGFAPASGPG